MDDLGRPGEVPVQPFPAYHSAFWGGNGRRVCACERPCTCQEKRFPPSGLWCERNLFLLGLALLKSTPVNTRNRLVPVTQFKPRFNLCQSP